MRHILSRPWIWSFIGALAIFAATLAHTGGAGAGGIVTAAFALASFAVVVGLGQMFVVSLGPGNIDLSLPANMGLASAVAMLVMDGQDGRIALGLGAAAASGLVIGLANYLLIRVLRIPPIIATLSSSFIVMSIDIQIGRGLQIKPPPAFADFTDLRFLGLPSFAWIVLAVTALAAVALSRTIYGRAVLAIGQNKRAAWLAGVRVEWISCATYALCGLLGGLDGALLAAYFRGSAVDIGAEYLLTSLAVVVIGGTSVAGGKSNVPGLWGAGLFLVLLQIMLNTYGAAPAVRLVATGLVIIGVITAAGGKRDETG